MHWPFFPSASTCIVNGYSLTGCVDTNSSLIPAPGKHAIHLVPVTMGLAPPSWSPCFCLLEEGEMIPSPHHRTNTQTCTWVPSWPGDSPTVGCSRSHADICSHPFPMPPTTHMHMCACACIHTHTHTHTHTHLTILLQKKSCRTLQCWIALLTFYLNTCYF